MKNEDYLCLPNPGRKSNLHSSFFILNSSFRKISRPLQITSAKGMRQEKERSQKG